MLDALTSQLAVLDADGQVVFTNAAWNAIDLQFGERRGLGGVGSDLMATFKAVAQTNPETAQATSLLRKVLEGRTSQGSLEYATNNDNGRRWIKCTIKRFPGPDRGHILVAQEDVTEIKQVEGRSDRIERQFRHLFESAPDAMVMVDQSGLIRLVNRKACDMFGYGASDLAGQPVEILIDPFSRERHTRLRRGFIDSTRQTAMGDSRSKLRGQRRDGREFPVEISLSRFSGAGDEYVVAAVRDVTMRAQAQADRLAREVAEEANRAKSNFLATMSHEIRTPLSAVLGLAEVLSQTGLSQDQLGLLANMRDSAGHLLRLIDDVLDFSKIEAGSLEIEEAPVDLCALIESAARGLADHAASRGVALGLFVATELPQRILSDDVRLRQILYNLLGNAIKFSAGRPDRNGRVALRAESAGDADAPILSLTVTDNGIGMDRAVVERLFQPFTQGEQTTTRKFGGTGLGLTICKRIVERMGGDIAVDSQPGRGAQFRVRLPLKALDGPPAPRRLAGVTCLLCDSTAYRSDDLRRYLTHEGAEVSDCDARDLTRLTDVAGPDLSRIVLITGADQAGPPGPAQALPRVLVGENGASRLAIQARNRVFVDARAMARGDLANAVAVALGQESVATSAIRAMEGDAVEPLFADKDSAPRILVAEDDLLNQSVILRQLELLGLQADIAGDGAEALEKWRKGEHALMLTDLHMPNMDGYALTAAIRAAEGHDSDNGRLPILALTANALRDEVSRTRNAGMDGYLTKPISLARLAEALRNWLPPEGLAQSGRTRPAIDRAHHRKFLGDCDQSVRNFLASYAQVSRDLVARLRQSTAEGRLDEVAMTAHRLKSSSRWIGAAGLGDLCEGLEAVATDGNTQAVAAHLPGLETCHARVLSEIETIINEPER
ncbi:MAG: Signal transduction histidine kinase [Rhodobacteraceae bacterium HLUCCA12]|nr:MAG: Signal transduction histidine kinase [Rhodobacteraceae bacterium HLUCCA12]